MTSKKLGALLRSVPPATAAESLEPASQLPAPESVDTAAAVEIMAPGRVVRAAAPPVEAEVPLQVLIPASIRKQLALMAAEEGQSLRALVLRAVRSLGVNVTEADIKGKRGRRNA